MSKAQEFIDIYRYPPSRPAPIYPTPQVDKPAAKCRKDVCLLPDCSCGGADIPGEHANCFLIGSTLDVRQKAEEEEEEEKWWTMWLAAWTGLARTHAEKSESISSESRKR